MKLTPPIYLLQDTAGAPSPTRAAAKQRALQKAKLQKQKLLSHSTAMESIQAQTEPIDEQEHLPYVPHWRHYLP